MSSKLTHLSAALRICVDQTEGGRVCGTVYSQRLCSPMPFSDLGHLLVQVDAVLDAQNFPQAFQRIRSFQDHVEHAFPACAAADPDEGMTAEAVSSARGKTATFVVYVSTRQSATWQGMVDWLDGSAPFAFSSALEFIKLVDGRLSKR